MTTEAFSWAEGHALINMIGSERSLASRIKSERLERGWSQAELSHRMGRAGHPLHQSAISKIEAPPVGGGARTVTIDEAIGFSKVFNIPVGELLLPPEAGLAADLWRRFGDAVTLREQARAAWVSYKDLLEYQLIVPADSAVPEAAAMFLRRLKEHRDLLERDERSRQRAMTGSSHAARYIENYEPSCEMQVADDILNASARSSREV